MHLARPARLMAGVLATLALLLTVFVLAPVTADAALEVVSNGVTTDGNGNYWCDGKLAVVKTGANIRGTQGDDVIFAKGDAVESVNGRAGDDTICVEKAGTFITGSWGDDHIFGPDQPTWWDPQGSDGPPITTIKGGPGADVVFAGDGWDNINGGNGDDILHGGGGYDFIWGGTGADLFDGDDNLGPDGEATSHGDLCVGFEAPMVDMQMECERWETEADMPWSDTPHPGYVECVEGDLNGRCPFAHWR